jgi:hypothetical protein
VRSIAWSQSLPTANTQDLAPVVRRDAVGAPVAALVPVCAPIPDAPAYATTVIETLEPPVLVSEALIAALLNVPVARAHQISEVPSSAFVRPTSVQLRPPPETLAVWPPLDGPSPATYATSRFPTVGVESVTVALLVAVAVPFASMLTPAPLALTVSVAAVVVVEPNAFVNVASYLVPLCATVVAGVVYDVDVAPVIAVNELAPGASEDHCTVGAEQFTGVDPAAVNVAVAGAVTVTLDGLVVTDGSAAHAGGLTVSVAALESVDPSSFVNTAWYSLPDSDAEVGLTVSVPVVLPESVVSFDHVRPPFVETCHWTVSVWQSGSLLDAAAVNVAAAGAVTV